MMIEASVFAAIVALAIVLFSTNFKTIDSHVASCEKLCAAAHADALPKEFERAVVDADGKVLKKSSLISVREIGSMRYEDTNVLKRIKERSSTGGGFVEIFDCDDRKLETVTAYVQQTDDDTYTIFSRKR